MNKVILSGIAASLLVAGNLSAKSIDAKLMELEKIIQQQQQQIQMLKKEVQKSSDASEEVEELDERLSEIETRSFTDKIQFGLGMKVEANKISRTKADSSKQPKHQDAVFRTRVNLNMKAKITDNMKFTGRLAMYKNWGDNLNDGISSTYNFYQGRLPDNSTSLHVTRAYIDWVLNPESNYPVTLTLGRQPGTDGPSHQIKEGTQRKGTYDALAFDALGDAGVATFNLDNLMPGTTSLRIGYGISNNGNDYNTNMKDTKLGILFLDKTLPQIKQDHLFQLYAVTVRDFMLNPNAKAKDPQTGKYISTDINIGDVNMFGGMFEIRDLNGFDLFAHYSKSIAKAEKTPHGIGLLSDGKANKDISGHAFWLGARYNFDKTWAAGLEYNKGSKNWLNFTKGANDPINKLGTRGDAWETYVSYNINKYANLRLGHVIVNNDYVSPRASYLGKPVSISDGTVGAFDKKVTNTYLNLNLLF